MHVPILVVAEMSLPMPLIVFLVLAVRLGLRRRSRAAAKLAQERLSGLQPSLRLRRCTILSASAPAAVLWPPGLSWPIIAIRPNLTMARARPSNAYTATAKFVSTVIRIAIL